MKTISLILLTLVASNIIASGAMAKSLSSAGIRQTNAVKKTFGVGNGSFLYTGLTPKQKPFLVDLQVSADSFKLTRYTCGYWHGAGKWALKCMSDAHLSFVEHAEGRYEDSGGDTWEKYSKVSSAVFGGKLTITNIFIEEYTQPLFNYYTTTREKTGTIQKIDDKRFSVVYVDNQMDDHSWQMIQHPTRDLKACEDGFSGCMVPTGALLEAVLNKVGPKPQD